MRFYLKLFSVLSTIGLALAGCGDESTDSPLAETPEQEAAITYAQDIAPLMEANCVGCHSEGGAAPFLLDSFEGLVPLAESALVAMESGTMPPWLPDPECRTFEDERLMETEEIALFREWVEGGKAPGDLSAIRTVEAPQTANFEATHTAAIANPYTPSQDSPDDYRCFVLDVDFDREMFLTASTVLPDAGTLVHHVLVYAIGPNQLDIVLGADENESGEGYTCFGAPFPSMEGDLSSVAAGLPAQVGAWVPGSSPRVYEEGSAVRIEAGSKIVMQIHYNVLADEPTPDQTAFVMRLTEETPDFLVETKPLVIESLEIPAGESEAINRRTYTNHGDKAVEIASVAAHMHLLGSRYSARIERVGGENECLLEIPRWDFNWQQGYRPPEPVVLEPGDAISLECVYDNSQGNQPFVNGEQIEPRDVTWGDGTLDEMCMLYLSTVKPFEPIENDGLCGGAAACAQNCEAEGGGATDCILKCAEGLSCQICGLRSVATCGGSCLRQFGALQATGCLETCVIASLGLGSDVQSCMASTCGESYAALTDCVDPLLDSGECDESLIGCGLRE